MIHLDLPPDVKKFVLKVQGEAKAAKGVSQYSLQKTIIQIIRSYKLLEKKSSAKQSHIG